MIFDLLDYILGSIKMIFNKIIYLKKISIPLVGKYSRTVQIRIFDNGRLNVGKGFLIRSGVKIRINSEGKVIIGNRVGFNNDCMINCMDKIKIGNNVIFGQGVKLYDHDHDYKKKGTIRDNGYISKEIVIGDNIWIGSNCVILKGSTIGSNTIIGANTVVYGNIPDNTVVYGQRRLSIKCRLRKDQDIEYCK